MQLNWERMTLKTLGVARHQGDGRSQRMGNSINKAALTLPGDSQAFLKVIESQSTGAKFVRQMIRIEEVIAKRFGIESLQLMFKLLKRQLQSTPKHKMQYNKRQQD